MTYCDVCTHKNMCDNEGLHDDPPIRFCDDFAKFQTDILSQVIKNDLRITIEKSPVENNSVIFKVYGTKNDCVSGISYEVNMSVCNKISHPDPETFLMSVFLAEMIKSFTDEKEGK